MIKTAELPSIFETSIESKLSSDSNLLVQFVFWEYSQTKKYAMLQDNKKNINYNMIFFK